MYNPENLVYEALPGLLVRSQDEALISKALANVGIPFYYEKLLPSKDKQSFCLPDFTFQYRRKTHFGEHRGMFDDPQYARDWQRKERWYRKNGYKNQLIITPVEGMSIEQSIRYILHDRLGVADGLEKA